MSKHDHSPRPILVAGRWQNSNAAQTFCAHNPKTGEALPSEFPISDWVDCDAVLTAAAESYTRLRTMPGERIADFLDQYAREIERRADSLVKTAALETGLPASPRLQDVELPRTTNQLRQAAEVARSGSWQCPTIDTAANIRSCRASIGPVCVFGPNNFPFAFGSISGGDFAAAMVAGNPVIGKANSSHPETTQIFGEAVLAALQSCEMPMGMVQLIYRTSHGDGERLVADPRVAATGYTGSRTAGLKLKRAAESAGKQIFLELSSCNPVLILPAALQQDGSAIAQEFCGSCLMGTGQFCTNPGLVLLLEGPETDQFVDDVRKQFQSREAGALLSIGVQQSLLDAVKKVVAAGAELIIGGTAVDSKRYAVANTLLTVRGDKFLANAEALQTELFGNASLFVVLSDIEQAAAAVRCLEGNLTGTIYSHTAGKDDLLYDRIAPELRQRVGRLLNDKMPTGVAVSPAMNHGGPFPATGSPHFTAVGMPAAVARFTALHCYDHVRESRLPDCLQDKSPNSLLWRSVDGCWVQGSSISN